MIVELDDTPTATRAAPERHAPAQDDHGRHRAHGGRGTKARARTGPVRNSNGCAAGDVPYMEWRFIAEGGGAYEVQSQYADKECIYLTGPATLKPCNAASRADLLNYLQQQR